MTYLYGDATPSPLESNFIEFLRDAIDFAVRVVLAGQRLEEGRERIQARRQSTAIEVGRLEALDLLVQHALAGAVTGAAESPTARRTAAIAAKSTEMVQEEIENQRRELSKEIRRIEGEAAEEGRGCVRLLEQLIRKHDLPYMATTTTLRVIEGGHYEARLHAATAFGLSTVVELEAPAGHLLAHVLRVERIVERLEVQAPESTGWLQKRVKIRPQRLDRLFLVELSVRPGDTSLKLRAGAGGDGDGFDLTVSQALPARVDLVPVGERADTDVFELEAGDAAKVVELRDKLVALALELGRHRRSLVEALLEGKSVAELTQPTDLVERLIAAIAPIVHEIERHSLSATELVLKRVIGDDKREECFVSKEELATKIAEVPDHLRHIFDPLGIAGVAAIAERNAAVAAGLPPPSRPPPTPPPPPASPRVVAEVAAAGDADTSEPAISIDDNSLVLEEEK